jgi:hypothetical protein
MAQFLSGKKFKSVVAVEKFFASKDKEWFYQAFKELAENGSRPLNMRACILNMELFCMFSPIIVFISNPTFIYGAPSVIMWQFLSQMLQLNSHQQSVLFQNQTSLPFSDSFTRTVIQHNR